MVEYHDGDIFRWRWRDDARDSDRGAYRAYHCKSQIAIAKDGRLYDTYWAFPSYEHELDPAEIILTFEGNPETMTAIRPGSIPYYRPEDILDTRHSNHSGAAVYLRAGATKDPVQMRTYLEARAAQFASDANLAKRRFEEVVKQIEMVDRGELESVYL